jgi:hydroxymethylpyrimidine kinase/phosphomethylpyrimidine kinase/thiamine-phosphate diphosphorylase
MSAISVAEQIAALRRGFLPHAIKIGMIGDLSGIIGLKKLVQESKVPVICDPILTSTSGTALMGIEVMKAMQNHLYPDVTVLTPNLFEAERLAGFKIDSPDLMEKAARKILNFGVKSVVIKGGHAGGTYSQDYWTNGHTAGWLTSARKLGQNSRGTGCTFASALAVAHAFGFEGLDAVVIAKTYINQCLRLSFGITSNSDLLQYGSWPGSSVDLPWLTQRSEDGLNRAQFPGCRRESIGFYPIVDRAHWFRRILPLGVKTVQIRIKDLRGEELENEIRQAILLSRDFQCKIFINDYWELALKHGAFGTHLGQEDTSAADVKRLSKTGIHLGLSTHCFSEVARAHSICPSYVAIGPIFPTTIKAMKFAPQGVRQFQMWRRLLDYPLVAIGGITLENANLLLESGADGVSVVSDITRNQDPESRAVAWLRKFKDKLD